MVNSNSQNIVLDHFPEHRQILFGHRYSLVRTERKFFLGTVNIASSSSIQEAKILSFDKKFNLKLWNNYCELLAKKKIIFCDCQKKINVS
jgi:hypothetical protein